MLARVRGQAIKSWWWHVPVYSAGGTGDGVVAAWSLLPSGACPCASASAGGLVVFTLLSSCASLAASFKFCMCLLSSSSVLPLERALDSLS